MVPTVTAVLMATLVPFEAVFAPNIAVALELFGAAPVLQLELVFHAPVAVVSHVCECAVSGQNRLDATNRRAECVPPKRRITNEYRKEAPGGFPAELTGSCPVTEFSCSIWPGHANGAAGRPPCTGPPLVRIVSVACYGQAGSRDIRPKPMWLERSSQELTVSTPTRRSSLPPTETAAPRRPNAGSRCNQDVPTGCHAARR